MTSRTYSRGSTQGVYVHLATPLLNGEGSLRGIGMGWRACPGAFSGAYGGNPDIP